MSVTIELAPELESALRDAAARRGVDTQSFILAALEDVAHRAGQSKVPWTESELLGAINQGLSEETWQRYRELSRKRRDGALTNGERRELIALGDSIERAHAVRMARVLELARLKNTTFDSMLRQLGIVPVAIDPPDLVEP